MTGVPVRGEALMRSLAVYLYEARRGEEEDNLISRTRTKTRGVEIENSPIDDRHREVLKAERDFSEVGRDVR